MAHTHTTVLLFVCFLLFSTSSSSIVTQVRSTMASFSLPKGRIGSRKKVLNALPLEVEVSSTQDGV